MRLEQRDIQYKILQGTYWMLYGLATAFVTVFLLSKGFSSSVIGVIVAVSNILSAFGQMGVGTLVDAYEKITWKRLILIFAVFELATLVFMLMFSESMAVNGVMFPLLSLLMYFQMPLINAALFYYTQRGEKIDFGSARGTGSIAYAFISYVTGKCIVSFGEGTIVYIGIVLVIMLFAITWTMPYYKDNPEGKEAEQSIDKPQPVKREKSFIRTYPKFAVMCLGIALVMAFHNIVHTYMIQIIEPIGGDSGSMGTAFSIEAIVELPVMFGFFILVKKIKTGYLMAISGAGFVIKAICLCLAGSITTIYMAEGFQLISYAILASASVYYANSQTMDGDKVKGQGYITAAMAMGGMIGNLLGGFIYDLLGLEYLKILIIGLALSGAVLMVFSGVLGKEKTEISELI